MFSMGRFDPRVIAVESEVNITKEQKIAKETKKARTSGSSGDEDIEELSRNNEDMDLDEPLVEGSTDGVIRKEKTYESDGDVSSSVPSSDDDSSSSAPSSDDEDEDHGPAMKVIAPEQHFTKIGIKRKSHNMTDEGMDDFDMDNMEEIDVQRTPEIENALRLSKKPIREVAKLWKLAPFLVDNLEKDEYNTFFPIQALVIPDVIASERHAHIRNRDICVSAPTGSGKTLSFVLPVLNALAGRRVRRLRALIVLPSRDLASQVYEVFERYSRGSDLKIGLAIGQTDFSKEQASLIVGHDHGDDSIECRRFRYALNPFDIKYALQTSNGVSSTSTRTKYKPFEGYCTYGVLKDQDGLCATPNGGSSTVDVLVCTPGRLMNHLESTPGFDLQHLRFLVIDEADRLVNQTYQNWIRRVMKASIIGSKQLLSNQNQNQNPLGFDPCNIGMLDPVTWRRDESDLDDTEENILSTMDTRICRPVQLRKLLFSATLTKDPRKLSSLGLVNPKHFDAHHLKKSSSSESVQKNKNVSAKTSYSLPESLTESTVECTAEQKPLVLLAFLLEQGLLDEKNKQQGITVIFTSSIDSTHRLARLLQLLYTTAGYGPAASVAEFSSSLTQKQRAKLMKRCNNASGPSSRIRVIVCSDGMSRGMDISSVTAVINYDVPSFAKTYVHRCGRTARAGRDGRAVTIMKGGQATKFRRMRELIDDPDNVVSAGIQKDLVKDAVPIYKKCVSALRKVLDAEENDGLSPVASLDESWTQ